MNSRDEFLGHLMGDWILTGRMGEFELRREVRSRWILQHTFVRMCFRSVTPVDNPTSNYKTICHLGYNDNDQTYVMHLLDTSEIPTECVMGRGIRSENELPFLFE